MKLAVLLTSSVVLLAGCATAPAPSPATTAQAAHASNTAAQRTEPGKATTASTTNEVQVARYTTLAPVPSEADSEPLAVVAKVHFPRPAVHTVGDAVRHLLLRTGYQLAAEDRLDERARGVLAMRLPDNQRVLGPYRVDTMLGVLLGRPFRLVADPASRTVTYISAAEGHPAGAGIAAATARRQQTTTRLESASASIQQRGLR